MLSACCGRIKANGLFLTDVEAEVERIVSDGLNEINEILAAHRARIEHFEEVAKNPREANAETLSKANTLRMQVVEACYNAVRVPMSEETQEIAGRVWLQRLNNACADQTLEHLRELFETARTDLQGAQEVPASSDAFKDATELFVDLAAEAANKAQEQQSEAMLEGFRRFAENTPGTSLRITEDFGDTRLRDEHVIGPEPGHEDPKGVGRMSKERMSVLGSDTNATQAHHSRIYERLGKDLVTQYRNLSSTSPFSEVVREVALRAIHVADKELDKAIALPEPPEDFVGMRAGHFSWLKGQMITGLNEPLIDGAHASRARQGDQQARAMIQTMAITQDSVVRAKGYYLPLGIDTKDRTAHVESTLPSNAPIIVFHDRPYELGAGIEVIAWLMHTTEDGQLEPVATAYIVEIDPVGNHGMDIGVASLETQAASIIRERVEKLAWHMPEQLKIHNKPGSRKWQRKIEENAEILLDNGNLAEVHLPL